MSNTNSSDTAHLQVTQRTELRYSGLEEAARVTQLGMRHRLRALLVVVACTVAAAARPEPRPGNDTVDEADVGWAQPRGRNQKIGQSWLQLHDGLVRAWARKKQAFSPVCRLH